ncbi:helix-turn-helix domain-containing protein [Patescibacteria group bacterium]|nr:helix-turn-helix domain-containing protein [Patescibacteria group bacterium]MBU4265239.1 helix-turn-helix domain-containing protein [Patescibacteria group bacterium]MBU4390284.1 helix-turn-helix domain-containing protein [Patescibacteria group bacterium]MBU4578698.1 helix-turn-helix domain-containing protein [Patescibacteria group bacterium]MCG2701832.1 helix-turn-helix domain-containing protein [Candidatus Parcubacteria bacterium]
MGMVTEKDIRLGKKIKKYRKLAGLTQDQLAEKTKLSTKYIQFIEAGSRKPSLKTIYRLARTLEVKVRDLFPF